MANIKPIEYVYCEVFGVNKNDVKKPKHQQIIQNAVNKVWAYEDNYPGETDEQKELRLELDGPAQGEVSGLAFALKSISGWEDIPGTAMQVIFEVYKRMKFTEESNVTEDNEVDSTNESTRLDKDVNSDKENKNIYTSKEDDTMSSEALTQLEAMEKEAQAAAGKDIVDNGSNLPKASSATKKAAQDLINDQAAERISVTKNARVEELVLAQPAAAARAVKGEEAVGIIDDPAKALKNFKEKFGVKTDENGNVTFARCVEGEEENAKQIYNLLVAAESGANEELKAHIGKGTGSLIGFRYTEENGGASTLVNVKELMNFIATKAAGFLQTTDENIQVQLTTAKNSGTRNNAGAGTGAKAKSQKAKSVMSLKVPGKANAVEAGIVAYNKEITETVVNDKKGFKSEVSAKYISKNKTADGEPKQMTYRIPLLVPQFEVKQINQEMIDKFPVKSITDSKIIDVANDDALRGQIDAMAKLIAEAIANNESIGGLGEDIRKAAVATEEAEVNEQASELPV